MFFDPDDYLERDPATAKTKVEAERLVREAGQRARLCEEMARQAAEVGFEAASAHRVFSSAKLGALTFYKLFPTREACLLEAFKKCAAVILDRVEAAVAGGEKSSESRAGLEALVELLAAEPDVARLVLVEIRVGGMECREAQLHWLGKFRELLEEAAGPGAETEPTRMVVGALNAMLALEVAAGQTGKLAEMVDELVEVARLGCVAQPQRR